MATTTWTQTAGMVSDEDTDNVESFAEQAEASKDAAAASETAAASSAASAAASATAAGTDAATATTGAATATTKAAEASTSASNAATSASNASTSEANASSSAASAASSAAAAATSETNAATSATSAAASAASVGTEAADAAASATAAAASEAAAAASEAAAATSETNSATSEANAATSASSASTSAANAATSETNAATSEANAATSEANSATSETNAATSASSASTSASNAATSASAASASQVAAAASAASAANSYDLFDDRYLGTKTSDPTVDNDGNALVAGALYFNSTANEMRVYDGGNWIAASSAGGASLLEYKYTATSGQTTFSGADDNANSLSYTQDNLIVTLNGVVLENGTDYTATNGTSVVLASGAATSDELNVIAFKTFTTADMVAASTGGTFYGDVDVAGTLTSDGLTVDTNTLHVDAANNRVGIGTSSPSAPLQVTQTPSDTVGDVGISLKDANNAIEFGLRLDSTSKDLHLDGYYSGAWHNRMTIDRSSGNVGIGTSSPSSKLHISQATDALASGLQIRNAADTSSLFIYQDGIDTKYDTGTSGSQIFRTNNTERMRIDSSGNVGIGTSSPTYTLDVVGTINASERLRIGGGAALYAPDANELQVGSSSAGDFLTFYTDNGEAMRIDSSGSVGIGTSSPSTPLHIKDSNGGLVQTIETGDSNAAYTKYINSTTGSGTFTDGLLVGIDTDESATFWQYEASHMKFGTSGSERMRIDSSGNVGIGTGSPSEKLEVSGTGHTRIQVTAGTSSDAAIYLGDSGDADAGAVIYDNAPNALKFRANGSERMRIDSSGNVGIGTTSPSGKLDITTGTTGNVLIDAEGSSNFHAKVVNDAGDLHLGSRNTSSDTYLTSQRSTVFKTGSSETERMRINSSGDLAIGKTDPTAFSTAGIGLYGSGEVNITRNNGNPVYIRRNTSDGGLVAFYQDGNQEGTISVSGSTVSYNGGHLARWSQLADGSKDTSLLKGTVLTNLDQMAVWSHDAVAATYYEEGDELPEGVSVGDEKTPAADAYTEDNEQLNCMAVSSVEGDPNVAGVFVNWDNDDDHFNDMNIAMTGDMVIRIAQGTTVQRGDLLMSAGDGTAKPQGDDIVRSKTIAKVTSTHVTCTYDDGSYCVPCVLMAC
jgi:hypothetical protein